MKNLPREKNLVARKKVGERVRKAREAQGLSLREAARRIDLHYNYLSDVECGRRNTGLDNLVRIARGLRLDPGDLIRGLR